MTVSENLPPPSSLRPVVVDTSAWIEFLANSDLGRQIKTTLPPFTQCIALGRLADIGSDVATDPMKEIERSKANRGPSGPCSLLARSAHSHSMVAGGLLETS